MALQESKQIIFSKYIQRELSLATVFERLCDKKYEGEIEYGKTVKMISVLRPTIAAYVNGTGHGDPEAIQDAGQFLVIDKQYGYNFIDHETEKKQHRPEVVQDAIRQAALGLAEQRDTDIAEAAGKQAGGGAASAEIDAESEWEAAVAAGDQWLAEQNVPRNAKKFLVIKPWMTKYFRGWLTADKTRNDELIANGVLGKLWGIDIIESNNLYNDSTDDYVLMGTYGAIGFAGQTHSLQQYDTHDKFRGTVYRGLDTYGTKVLKPKELYVIKAHE